VLVRESVAYLAPRPGLFLDATLGDGGHAEALLLADPQLRLLANDRDRDALAGARARLARFGDRVTFAPARCSTSGSPHARSTTRPAA
jgi:16S rRNA (cytosine1402-N4)-methyltransferase